MSDLDGEDAFRLVLTELMDAKDSERRANAAVARLEGEKRTIATERDEIASRLVRAEGRRRDNEKPLGELYDAVLAHLKMPDDALPSQKRIALTRVGKALDEAEIACGKVPF